MSRAIIAVAAPTVTASIWTIKSGWSAITDWATFLLAVATLSVAYLTRKLSQATVKVAQETNRLAQETARMVQQEDEHHRERFMPVCALIPQPPFGSRTERSDLVGIQRVGDHNVNVVIRCGVKNAGVGPALGVLVRFRSPDGNGERGMSAIGAGELLNERDPTLIAIEVDPGAGHASGYQMERPVTKWEIDLEYTDVFGQAFITRHTSDPETRWARFDRVGGAMVDTNRADSSEPERRAF